MKIGVNAADTVDSERNNGVCKATKRNWLKFRFLQSLSRHAANEWGD